MKKIVAIFTGKGLLDPLQAKALQMLPGIHFVSIVDDAIIGACVQAGKVPDEVRERLLTYYRCAEQMGADVILNTCSSVGDVVYEGRELVKTPIVRIDEAMARHAVRAYRKIAVVATLPTTLDPTARLLSRVACEEGCDISVVSGLAEGAYQALISGNPQAHDQKIQDTVVSLAQGGVECVLLAQASMMRMEQALRACVDIPVIASPEPCFAELSAMLAAHGG